MLGWHAQLYQAYNLLRPLVEERHTKAKAAQRARGTPPTGSELWKTGQMIMIRNSQVHKGDTHWVGPYLVKRYFGQSYTLESEDGFTLKRVVPHDQTKAVGDNFEATYSPWTASLRPARWMVR